MTRRYSSRKPDPPSTPPLPSPGTVMNTVSWNSRIRRIYGRRQRGESLIWIVLRCQGEAYLVLCRFLGEEPCGSILVDRYIPGKANIPPLLYVFLPQFETPADKSSPKLIVFFHCLARRHMDSEFTSHFCQFPTANRTPFSMYVRYVETKRR